MKPSVFDTPEGVEALRQGYATNLAMQYGTPTPRTRWRVTLTPQEMAEMAAFGTRHRQACLARQASAGKYGAREATLQLQDHILARQAEQAFSRMVDRPMVADDYQLDRDCGDVPPYFVRSTKYARGHLLLTEADPADRVFVLVTGAGPAFEASGWLYAREGQQPRFWTTLEPRKPHPRFNYFVPQAQLHPMDELPPP